MKANIPVTILNENKMPETKFKQLEYERDHWKRSLDFMSDANIENKNSIARLVKDNLTKSSLNNIEIFLNKFLAEDNIISLLRNEIAELNVLLTGQWAENAQIQGEIYARLKKLRITIAEAEEQSNRLKTEFNSFLSVNVFYS